MENLLELCFENADINAFIKELLLIIEKSRVADVQSTALDTVDYENQNDLTYWKQLIEVTSWGQVGVNFEYFNFENLEINNLTLMIYKPFDNKYIYDIYFLFIGKDIKKYSEVRNIQRWSLEFQKKIGASEVYFGIEPARDLDTRFFTCHTLGPIAF